ncbi:MAG: hypothetical protein VYC39_13265 [Myxococcota bacterium]|nr:hypothetical protein [Myxococcota bacterium]
MNLIAQNVVETAEIRGRRAKDKRRAIFTSVLQTQFLFWSWVLGWFFGPAGLSPREIAVGFAFSVFLGLMTAFIGLRHYLEREAKAKVRLREGGKKKRLVLYPRHFWVNDEVILRQAVDGIVIEESSVTIRYVALGQDEEVKRTFSGPSAPVDTFRDYLQS